MKPMKGSFASMHNKSGNGSSRDGILDACKLKLSAGDLLLSDKSSTVWTLEGKGRGDLLYPQHHRSGRKSLKMAVAEKRGATGLG